MNPQESNGKAAPTIVDRSTKETKVHVHLARGAAADAPQPTMHTGEPFLDHVLTTLARYAALDLRVVATGDLRHHLIEDVAIAVGAAVSRTVSDRITRYGERTIPMDDALVQVALDLGGRPYYRGPLPSGLYDHWMRSFADHARATLHVRVIRGLDRHHIVEAAFKGLGFALREALTETQSGISTKGAVQW
jgi:imidazoleglycerol-phosphate dehydratase